MSSDDIVFSHPHDHFTYRHVAVVPNTCFVLMPFERKFTIVYETITRALEGHMTCTRADDLPIGKPILERIISGIRSSELVIADLTGRNANVFYEVGLAHTCTKNVLLLTQDIADVPFDLRGFFCHVYSPTSQRDLQTLEDVVRRAAAEVRAKGVPAMLRGATERTKQLVEYMERELNSPLGGRGLIIRLQAGFSSVSNEGYPEAKDEQKREYGTLLEKERDCLIKLLEQGALLQAIIYPPVGPWSEGRWRKRYDRLLAFLCDRHDLASHCEFVYAVEGGPNLFFFGEEMLFEGHKTGIEGGFGWTMVYTDKEYLRTRLTIFDMLFQAARSHTLSQYGRKGAAEGDRAALREAVIRAVLRARDGQGGGWTAQRAKRTPNQGIQPTRKKTRAADA
jgi:hypothetical protein